MMFQIGGSRKTAAPQRVLGTGDSGRTLAAALLGSVAGDRIPATAMPDTSTLGHAQNQTDESSQSS